MGHVQVGDHVWVRVSRRSLCDNCSADLCLFNDGRRITECRLYRPTFSAFKKCQSCGGVFDVSTNVRGLNYELCPKCNSSIQDEPSDGL